MNAHRLVQREYGGSGTTGVVFVKVDVQTVSQGVLLQFVVKTNRLNTIQEVEARHKSTSQCKTQFAQWNGKFPGVSDKTKCETLIYLRDIFFLANQHQLNLSVYSFNQLSDVYSSLS